MTAVLLQGEITTLRVGVFTPLLSQLPLSAVLDKLKSIGIDTVELGTGNYPGDALKLASVEEPPLRIVLGIDAFNGAEANDLAKIELGRNGKILATRRTS
jgi:hypothetical protein